jgi:hypothetical protein
MSISTVTSEALQLKLRQLLPSQQGFGTDLSASDTIIPVIDLTRAAEGSDTPETLQRALAFGSQTAFNVVNATTTLINTTGFYDVSGAINLLIPIGSASAPNINFSLTDGLSTKVIYGYDTFANPGSGAASAFSFNVLFTVFLNAGESLVCTSSATTASFVGSVRQIADNNGTLVQPVGFTPQ